MFPLQKNPKSPFYPNINKTKDANELNSDLAQLVIQLAILAVYGAGADDGGDEWQPAEA